MIVSNVSLGGCVRGDGAWCAGHAEAPSSQRTLSPVGHLVVAVCLGFIGTFGFLNNLLVLLLFCRYKVLRSPINLLLMNISLSDLLVCIGAVVHVTLLHSSDAGCPQGVLTPSYQMCPSGIVSLISLAVLSYERYCTMMGPVEADATNYRKIAMGIGLSWVYSLAWTLPPLFGWSAYGPEGPGTTCSVNWTTRNANNISYIISLFVFCLILPFIVIVYCYGKLLHAIKQIKY
ncbi:hypothetical protein Z043_120730 [Scleropages formosus]|uniref:G-protein coupled receptors family 1 profile domain-containing protein n=1 Tax=Scleropages formosus TaxID=113540 RepID=A0A0P7WDI3_SCLFO|nr:hypothetical protein Z043_120730 [Scleropages formosus]